VNGLRILKNSEKSGGLIQHSKSCFRKVLVSTKVIGNSTENYASTLTHHPKDGESNDMAARFFGGLGSRPKMPRNLLD
jgi:hypothetical protein